MEGSAPTTRQKMLGHLMKSVLPGKSRTEVEKLLGPPSQSTFGKVFEADSFYYLGNERGLFSIDSEWLLIWYDDRGEFERAALVAD